MAEQITLTTPVGLGTMASLVWDKLHIDFVAKSVHLQWKDNLGRGFSAVYPTPIPAGSPNTVTGAQMLNVMNTGNHSVNSLAKKMFQQLQTDGYIAAGAISGSAD